MSTLVVFLTNGRRECLPWAVSSFDASVLVPEDTAFVIVDDSGDEGYRRWIRDQFAYPVHPVAPEPAGYNAAMREIWVLAKDYDYVFMVEDDFVFNRGVELRDMIDLLEVQPTLGQIVLLRQAWFPNEFEAGGLIAALAVMGHKFGSIVGEGGLQIALPHRATWSTNPNLFRGGAWVENHPWPIGDGSEYRFGQELFAAEPETVCAYWGAGDEYVTHDGERKGFGY